MGDLSENEQIALSLQICNSLSLLGSFSIVFVYLFYKSLRSFSFKLVFFMSLSDMIRAFGFLLPTHPYSLCLAQSLLTSYGSLSGVIWTAIIAFSLYCVVILEMGDMSKYQGFMILIGYVLPFFIILLPLTTKSYGYAGGWCWLKADEFQLIWRIGSFYAIVILVMAFNIWSYYQIITEIRYEISLLAESSHEISNKQMLFSRFSLYPLVLVACYAPLLGKRIYEIANNNEIFWLTIFCAVTTSIIGLLNAIVYGFTNNVRETVLNSCKKKRTYSSASESMMDEDAEDANIVNASEYD